MFDKILIDRGEIAGRATCTAHAGSIE